MMAHQVSLQKQVCGVCGLILIVDYLILIVDNLLLVCLALNT